MHIQFAELAVFDQDRAKAFYAEHFGCTVAADVPMGADGWRWIELKFAGADTALHFVSRQDETPSEGPVMVLIDGALGATVESLRSKGVEIVSEPQPAPYDPGRTVAEFRDSEGNRMVLSSPSAEG
ncbi:VOC family protein [Mesorhizobium sp. LHD-90]|uniref:VOC family protein n=1 Tax=Mesorhizobium sp. LHD-90 TaxID=3071414 RepID=UPI0027DFBD8F|nr:VOC family protein [Mesorhizobium sp. LHD-90]MDQ6435883.1 VOC family protein [Mesorhizobium sp. LHD-90]